MLLYRKYIWGTPLLSTFWRRISSLPLLAMSMKVTNWVLVPAYVLMSLYSLYWSKSSVVVWFRARWGS